MRVLVPECSRPLGERENVSQQPSLQMNQVNALENQLWDGCNTWCLDYSYGLCNYRFVAFTQQIRCCIWLLITAGHTQGSTYFTFMLRVVVVCDDGLCPHKYGMHLRITKQSRDCFRWLAPSDRKCIHIYRHPLVHASGGSFQAEKTASYPGVLWTMNKYELE